MENQQNELPTSVSLEGIIGEDVKCETDWKKTSVAKLVLTMMKITWGWKLDSEQNYGEKARGIWNVVLEKNLEDPIDSEKDKQISFGKDKCRRRDH